MNNTNASTLYHTRRLLHIHRGIIGALSFIIVVGASISAIRIGNAPVFGPIVALAIMGAFFAAFYAVSKHIERGLLRSDPMAWIGSLFLALCMCVFIIGIPATKELLASEVRQQFL